MTAMRKIVPCLWFDDRAEEAARAYAAAFEDAEPGEISRYGDEIAAIAGRPPGSVLTAGFRLPGLEAVALNGGPHFALNPSISFFVNCDSAAEVDALYARFSDGGTVLMPLQAYPFNERYAWLQDRFGTSWQFHTGGRPQKVVPFLMFSGRLHGRLQEAVALYTSIFPDSRIEEIGRRGEDGAPDPAGRTRHAVFHLAGHEVRALDSPHDHPFAFNEAFSLQVMCDSQEEVDHYWSRLGEGGAPEAQQCGWLKDRYGLSWQVVPRRLIEMLRDPDAARVGRVSRAFLQMKKFDIAALERAYAGEAA